MSDILLGKRGVDPRVTELAITIKRGVRRFSRCRTGSTNGEVHLCQRWPRAASIRLPMAVCWAS